MKKALAIDVGGTKIYSTIVNDCGEIIGEIEKYSTSKNYAEIISTFKEIISKHENEVDVIAFSTCGAVNNENKVSGSTFAPVMTIIDFNITATGTKQAVYNKGGNIYC